MLLEIFVNAHPITLCSGGRGERRHKAAQLEEIGYSFQAGGGFVSRGGGIGNSPSPLITYPRRRSRSSARTSGIALLSFLKIAAKNSGSLASLSMIGSPACSPTVIPSATTSSLSKLAKVRCCFLRHSPAQ